MSLLALFVWSGSALASAATQSSDAIPAEWRAFTTAELAKRFLPPALREEVIAHDLSPPITTDQPPFSVTFFGRPSYSGDGVCERRHYYVSPLSSPENFVEGKDLRLGICPEQPATFGHVQPNVDPAQAKAALKWLAWAQITARSHRTLPFEVKCTSDGGPNPCSAGAKAALARLSLSELFIIGKPHPQQTGQWDFAIRGNGRVWDVQVRTDERRRTTITLNWQIPPPF